MEKEHWNVTKTKGGDDCWSFPLCTGLDLEENTFGRGIAIRFNEKYKFVADEKLVCIKSKVLENMIKKKPKQKTSYKVNLPHFEHLVFFVDYFKTGRYCSFTLEKFPGIYMNALALKCPELIDDLQFIFHKHKSEIVKNPNFKRYVPNDVFIDLMFQNGGKEKVCLNEDKTGPSKNCKIFYETLDLYDDVNTKDIAQSFPYLWQLSKEFDLPYLKKDLGFVFGDLIKNNPGIVSDHFDMNSKFIDHEDFKYLLVCYLDLRLKPICNNPDIVTINEEHCLVLKHWLDKHPGFIDGWYETFRFIMIKL